jgi:hypothetical protein
MFSQPFALAEQQELGKTKLLDRFRQIAPCSCQARWLTPDQFCRPLEVGNAAMPGF